MGTNMKVEKVVLIRWETFSADFFIKVVIWTDLFNIDYNYRYSYIENFYNYTSDLILLFLN